MGAAEFGAANPHQNTRFARAMSTFGQMERAVRDSDVGAVTAFRHSVANAEDGIARFTGSLSATLQIVEGGQHFLTASDPEVADAATLAFVEQWS